jgi:gluconate 2-dehydrogenase gamma chain
MALTRRAFLARAATVGAAVPFLAWLESCGHSLPPGVAADAPEAFHPFSFTPAQRAALSAAVARVIPAQGAGDWSAADAGAVEYVEQLLNAFVGAGNPKIYGGGPSRAQFRLFWKLPRVKQAAWLAHVTRLRRLYVDGLDELNREAAGGDYSALPAPGQDALLEQQDLQNTPFFATLFEHTMEGVYGAPAYGGNKDSIGWKSVCYQGDVHGVRFPGGHDPAADHQPWRKYGGYSPEEMIAPGQCGDEV